MARRGDFDQDGFASEDAWLEATASAEYPDALRRLVDGLTGTWMTNPPSVLFALLPGHSWGVGLARSGAWLLGGKLEATHGGLDRGSTVGFYLRSDAVEDGALGAVRSDRVLIEWADRADCLQALIID